ncbi:MAG TPA: shikimate dehydrogenase [Casimicrobiaceae bacterium]|nr:shikimate dehydrogenase [Casimicrobiaceae bacterium]
MPDRYAVIGNPVADSNAPLIHNELARLTGQDLVYERLLAPLEGFAATAERFASEGGLGLNVTVPFKLEALALAYDVTPRARHAGAVDTLRRERGRWYGDSTEGAGLVGALSRRHSVRIERCHVLMLGAGSAVRAMIGPLLQAHPRSLTVANRRVDKAVRIAEHFADIASVGAVSYAGLERRRFDLVIDATSFGVDEDRDARWPAGIFGQGAFAYDMAYDDAPTPFLRFAIAQGVDGFADGLSMLVEHAAESFFVWRGVRPDTTRVYEILRPGR